MKKITFAVISFVLTACFLLTSCSSSDFIKPVDTLLTPPHYYDEYESLLNAFRENVSETALFCSPLYGDYSSAIIVEDLDSDGEEEALVFYREGAESSVARMHYLNSVDGEWVSKGDFGGHGNEVAEAVITDMDSDGKSELVVLWSVSGVTSGSVMSLYTSSSDKKDYKEIAFETCTVCKVLDMDGVEGEEIFYMNNITTSGVSQRFARLMKISDNTLVTVGEAKLDPNISTYTAVKTEKVSEDLPLRIYVDALKGESQMITELIYWDSEKSQLCAPFLDPETMTNTATLRYDPIGCADINNDGIIDIPVQNTQFIGDGISDSFYITDWSNYLDNNMEIIYQTAVNYIDGYMIYFDKNEIGTTGIRNHSSVNSWVVYSLIDDVQNDIYSVRKVPKDRWNEEEFSTYIPIIERDDAIICVYITQSGSDMNIKEDYIKSRITKLPS